MEAVKLLPWCISAVVPLCYISEVASMATHQDDGISITSKSCSPAPRSESHSLPVPGQSGSPTPPPMMFPLPVLSIPNIPSDGTPLWGCLFAELTIPPKGKWDHTTSDLPDSPHVKRPCITSPEVGVRSEHNSTSGNDYMPNPTPETRTDSRQP